MPPHRMNPMPNEETLLAEALNRPAGAERAAFLDHACRDHPALRQRVEALLRAVAEAGDFLEEPPTGLPGEAASAAFGFEKEGGWIGPYKLLQQIGEGGHGVVYMAEQEKPVRRRVALKVIKLGMDTKSVIARFEAERQVLALMDHPNIAKVLDAGATETGRPYFVMELVRGIRLTEYCDQQRLPVQERLGLFMQVCQAIQHAHQKGIIHRDIKPSNILVTMHDGVPVPKVIDFGIAKATDQKLTDKTLFTQYDAFIGTPAYMSPEQAELSGFDIDTRSDIYSLGVLLYELLTGLTPFDPKTLMRAGLNEMRRIIREQEPSRPSTRLSTLEGKEAASRAERHREKLPILIHTVQGDLDWIVMKCLEKDRRRRYETANALITDVQRHLNHEPIVARPPSAAYRFHKMVQRNKVLFAAGTAVVLALVMGLGVATWMFFQQRHAYQMMAAAEGKARMESTKSEQISRFLQDILTGVQPAVARGRDTAMLREMLDLAVARLETELTDQPEVEETLRDTLGKAYLDLAEYPKAEAMYRAYLRLHEETHCAAPLHLPHGLYQLALAVRDQGRNAEAKTLLKQALELQKTLLGPIHEEVADSLIALASVYSMAQQADQVDALGQEALKIYEQTLGPDHERVAQARLHLLNFSMPHFKKEEKLELKRQMIEILRKQYTNAHPDLVEALRSYGQSAAMLGKLEDAERAYREGLEMGKKVFPLEHPVMIHLLSNLGTLRERQRRFDEAVSLYQQTLTMITNVYGDQGILLPEQLEMLGRAYYQENKLSEAEACFREAIRRRPTVQGTGYIQNTYFAVEVLGLLLEREGRLQEAEELLRESFRTIQSDLMPTQLWLIQEYTAHLSNFLGRQGRYADMEAPLREVLAYFGTHPGLEPNRFEDLLNRLSDALWRQGKFEEAEPVFRRYLASRGERLTKGDPSLIRAKLRAARWLSDWSWAEATAQGETRTNLVSATAHAREALKLMDACFANGPQGTNAAPGWLGLTKSVTGSAKLSLAFADTSLSPGARAAELAEAERLILEGHEPQVQEKGALYTDKRESFGRLIRLYDALGKTDQAAQWKHGLALFEQTHPSPDSPPRIGHSIER